MQSNKIQTSYQVLPTKPYTICPWLPLVSISHHSTQQPVAVSLTKQGFFLLGASVPAFFLAWNAVSQTFKWQATVLHWGHSFNHTTSERASLTNTPVKSLPLSSSQTDGYHHLKHTCTFIYLCLPLQGKLLRWQRLYFGQHSISSTWNNAWGCTR